MCTEEGRLRTIGVALSLMVSDGSRNVETVLALPNVRLKLAAPVPIGCRLLPEARCSRIPFVNLPARRRSLGAIR